MPVFRYRLQVLLDQKTQRKEKAQENLTQQRNLLKDALDNLNRLKVAKEEKEAFRRDRRAGLLRGASGGEDVRQRADYVKALEADVLEAKRKVLLQQISVTDCEEQVDIAAKHFEECIREVEVLTKHRTKAEERFRREQELLEEREQDEIGSVLHAARKRPS